MLRRRLSPIKARRRADCIRKCRNRKIRIRSVRNVWQDDGSGNNDHRGGQNGFGAPALDGANAQIPFGAPPQYNYGAANDYGAPVQERPMVFSIERDPNGYIYEYSDRLEYYRYTGAGMVLINSVKKNR